MNVLDHTVEWVARALPLAKSRRAAFLGSYFRWRFRRWPPCMASKIIGVNYSTFMGLPRDAITYADGEPRIEGVTWWAERAYWLEEREASDVILAAVARFVSGPGPVPSLMVDRSRIRFVGAPDAKLVSFHASYSLWRRMSDEEVDRLGRSEVVEADLYLSLTAFLYDKEGP
jgi:hypothetical protein